MTPIKIFLCDPTHDTTVLVSDTIPINIGFIAAYAKKIHGDEIDISLFKYPSTVLEAITNDPPDILGLSNYSWNSNLAERIARFAKQTNPKVITVQGGTNFAHDTQEQTVFLMDRPHTDLHVELEGELAFSNLITRVLQTRDGVEQLLSQPIDGCVYIHPESKGDDQPLAISGASPERLRDLDQIPSPYLTGLMEHFFDGRLTPFLETNRGCPFKCTFCHTGYDYFQKTNMFSIDRIQEEINYIAPRAAANGIVNLHLADTNFGMYPRDRQICEALKLAHDEYGWPLQIMATTGKNNKERVIDITGIMGNIFSVNMSVQSMDKQVLSNIKRDNIKLDDYIKINDHLNREGRATKGELILGMPGETKASFMTGLEQLIESGISSVCVYTLMMLRGTEFQNPSYRQQYDMVGKFRIVPLNFGEYEGERVLDYEEVCVHTKDMSFEEYLYIRGFALLVEALHNGRPFEELFRYAVSLGESRTAVLLRLYDALNDGPQEVADIMDAFLKETREELWDTEEALTGHYQKEENYQKLINGEIGGNLIYKYKSISLVFAAESWISFLSRICQDLAKEKLEDVTAAENAVDHIECLAQFCRNKLAGLLDVNGKTELLFQESSYDVIGWLRDDSARQLDAYALKEPVRYEFYYTDEQLKVRLDQFKRYGTDSNALSKIVTRISSVESVTRKVRTPDGEEPIYVDPEGDRFTRYMLAG